MTLSYTTEYPHSKGYYVVDGQTITLTCQFDVPFVSITWTLGGDIIYTYYDGTGTKADTIYDSRIHDYQDTENKHQLVLLVSKSVDEGQHLTCQVRISALLYETDESSLTHIFGMFTFVLHLIQPSIIGLILIISQQQTLTSKYQIYFQIYNYCEQVYKNM